MTLVREESRDTANGRPVTAFITQRVTVEGTQATLNLEGFDINERDTAELFEEILERLADANDERVVVVGPWQECRIEETSAYDTREALKVLDRGAIKKTTPLKMSRATYREQELEFLLECLRRNTQLFLDMAIDDEDACNSGLDRLQSNIQATLRNVEDALRTFRERARPGAAAVDSRNAASRDAAAS